MSDTLEARYAAVRAAAPAVVKSFLQRGERQLAAFVERHLAERGAGEGKAGAQIGAVSGRLSRALIPNQPGHIGKLTPPAEGALQRGPFGVQFGIDTRVIPYAAVHEYGRKITATPRMIAFFWARYMETGLDRWKWMALGARRRGFITIPSRPYFNPGVEEWVREQAPKELAKVQKELAKVFNGQ